MKNVWILALGGLIVAACGVLAFSQPPPQRGPGQGGNAPPPRGRERAPLPPPPPMRPWEPGKIMPPQIKEHLDLSQEQQKALIDLEFEVKDRILKLLTDEQKSKLDELKRHRAAGPPRDGAVPPPGRNDFGPPRGPGVGGPPPGREDGGPPPRRDGGPSPRGGRPAPPGDYSTDEPSEQDDF